MRKQKQSKWLNLLVIMATIMMMVWAANESWAAGAKYPTRLIQIFIGFQPGSTDMFLRPFTEKLPEYLGQPIAFVYKPGAMGTVAASFVARAKPDGYTLIGGSRTATCPLVEADYKLDDLSPICRLVGSPTVLAVKANSPWKTLKDIIEDAKKSPDKLTCSTSGVYGTQHIAMERFLKLAGIKITHVPCAGGGPAVTSLLGGHVDMVASAMAAVTPHLKSGELRPIVIFEKKRFKGFPDVPTATELGYPVVVSIWYGLLAPKGTPEEVVKTIYTACQKIVEDHKTFIEDRLDKLSGTLDFQGPEESAKEIREECEITKKIVSELEKSTPSKSGK